MAIPIIATLIRGVTVFANINTNPTLGDWYGTTNMAECEAIVGISGPALVSKGNKIYEFI